MSPSATRQTSFGPGQRFIMESAVARGNRSEKTHAALERAELRTGKAPRNTPSYPRSSLISLPVNPADRSPACEAMTHTMHARKLDEKRSDFTPDCTDFTPGVKSEIATRRGRFNRFNRFNSISRGRGYVRARRPSLSLCGPTPVASRCKKCEIGERPRAVLRLAFHTTPRFGVKSAVKSLARWSA